MALAIWDLYNSNLMVRLMPVCHHQHQPLFLGALPSGHPGHRDGRVPVITDIDADRFHSLTLLRPRDLQRPP
jgi:hypothetical protein